MELQNMCIFLLFCFLALVGKKIYTHSEIMNHNNHNIYIVWMPRGLLQNR